MNVLNSTIFRDCIPCRTAAEQETNIKLSFPSWAILVPSIILIPTSLM